MVFSSKVGSIRGGFNVGYRWRSQETKVLTLTVNNELFFKAALGVDPYFGKANPLNLEVVAEIIGQTPANNAFGMKSEGIEADFQAGRTPMELDVGIRAYLFDSILLNAGVGGGILPGYGAPAPRVFVTAGYYTGTFGPLDTDRDGVPDSVDQCPNKKEDIDQFEDDDGCPENDNDQDKIIDEDDQCPNEPEDWDDFEDRDGCPEADNDQDGFLDADDKCPNEAEDKDGFEDEDGCPDLDNDNDSIADAVDKCPLEAEDFDKFQDSDGCPEPDNDGDGLDDLGDMCPNHAEDFDGVVDDDGCPEDNDGDGIPDELDKCPNKAETYNGIDDEDGCPEKLKKVKTLVKVTEEKIEIKEKVFFKSGKAKINKKSFTLLDQVAAVLKNYKAVTKLRIEGHTDSRGSKRKNTRLSQKRADAVRDYLIEQGIAPERLEAVGMGPDQPIASNRNKRGRDANRRVEFMIAERKMPGQDVSEIPVEEPEAPAGDGDFSFDMEGDEAAPAEAAPAEPAPA